MALDIPTSDFKTEFTGGKIGDLQKALSGSPRMSGAGAVIAFALDNISPVDGFNVRVETPDYKAHIDDLKSSIRTEGFYADKPLAGFAQAPAGKEGEEGYQPAKLLLTDGYSRYRALKELQAEGWEGASQPIPVILKPAGQNMEDLTVALVRGNEGRALTVFEKSIVAKRLSAMITEPARVAERMGITARYLSDLLLLQGAKASLRTQVIMGKVSSTEAIKQLRADPANAAAKVDKAVKDAEAKGKTKATAKDADPKPVKAPKEPKAAATPTPAAAAAPATPVNDFAAVKKSSPGKSTHTVAFGFKRGAIVDTPKIALVRNLLKGTWWDYVDATTDKEHVVIQHDLKGTITFEVPDEDDTFADATTSSIPESATATAAADEKTQAEAAKPDPMFDDAPAAAPVDENQGL